MPSSWSASLRFELQFTGENINLWGDKLNVVLQHADYAVAGWLTKRYYDTGAHVAPGRCAPLLDLLQGLVVQIGHAAATLAEPAARVKDPVARRGGACFTSRVPSPMNDASMTTRSTSHARGTSVR